MVLRHTRTVARRATCILTLTLCCFATQSPAPSAARQRGDKALCKKIQQAMRNGDAIEQITADLQVDLRQVMRCMQSKGKGRKQKAPSPSTSQHAVSSTAGQPRIAKARKPAAPKR